MPYRSYRPALGYGDGRPPDGAIRLMRVGVIAPEFPPEVGGIQTYAFEFSQELARRGHAVTVFTVPHAEGELTVPGLNVVPRLTLRRRLDRAILQDSSMDVWHVMNASYAWIALETEPVVISVHGNDFLSPYIPLGRPDFNRLRGLWRLSPKIDTAIGRWRTKRFVRKGLPRAHHIMANSRYTEQILLKTYPACRGKTSAGMVGVAEDYFDSRRPPLVPGREPHLITVCRLSEPRKNIDRVLYALARLKQRYAFSYTIIGDGYLRPTLQELTCKLSLTRHVKFTGYLPKSEVMRSLAASDLFVLTSSTIAKSHEGFGIAYLEANACGTPVLAARLAGAAEAVQEGVSGMFVEQPTVAQITTALDQFFSHKLKFDAEACRRFARQFTWHNVVEHAVSHYRDPNCPSP